MRWGRSRYRRDSNICESLARKQTQNEFGFNFRHSEILLSFPLYLPVYTPFFESKNSWSVRVDLQNSLFEHIVCFICEHYFLSKDKFLMFFFWSVWLGVIDSLLKQFESELIMLSTYFIMPIQPTLSIKMMLLSIFQ